MSDDIIKKLQSLGYSFELGRDYEGAEDFGIAVKDSQGNDVGRTILRPNGDGTFSTHPYQQVKVEPQHRRKGIASAMYKFAEENTGMKATPASTQNELGKALWSNPNRPFGDNNTKKKLSDEQILQLISEFEALKEEDKAKRLLGQGVDKLVYDIPGQDMVMKIPNHTREYGNTSLENDYIYSKQLNKHVPVETPILVKRPDYTDVLLQKKLKPLGPEERVTDEFMNSLYDNYPDSDSRKSALKAEHKRLDTLPSSVAETNYYKAFDKAGLEDGDIHRGNLAFDKNGTTKAMDVGKFWFGDHAPAGVDVEAKNNGLHKMRETFSDKMDKLAKTRIFRQVAGALPLAGTAMALSSGDASAAAEELPSEIPFVGQAYDAIRPETAGSADDDRMMRNEVKSLDNYNKSQARIDALKKLGGRNGR